MDKRRQYAMRSKIFDACELDDEGQVLVGQAEYCFF